MNRALLNPFEALKLPDNLDMYLESEFGKATCMAFNRHGNVLAVGLSTGDIALWDFDTRSSDMAPVYYVGGQTPCEFWAPKGHHVTTVSFPAPRIGGHILASFAAASSSPPAPAVNGGVAKIVPQGRNGVVRSEHGTGVIRLCNTLDGTVFTEICFDMPIIHFVPHPTQADVMLVLPANMYPLIVTIAPGRCSIRRQEVYDASPVGPGSCKSFPTQPVLADPLKTGTVTVSVLHDQSGLASGDHSLSAPVQPSSSASGRRTTRVVLDPYAVSFSRDGRRIVRGGPDGIVHVFEFTAPFSGAGASRTPATAKLVNQFKVATGAAIRSLTLTKAKLLVNSADRSLRLFDADSIAPSPSAGGEASAAVPVAKTTFTEAVNRSQAKCACFSRDGDFVLAGMISANAHRIVVWRASDGHPETTLEGPGEGLLDLVWHPVQPVIASVGASYGGVYVWAKNFTENWSAFAPQFTELEANEEYDEDEGEFDAKHPSSDERVKLEREAEEEKIQVNVEAPFCFSSDEEGVETSSDPAGMKRSKVHKPFFSLPAIPEPDSYFDYASTDKNGNKARDVVKKRQRSRVTSGDRQGKGVQHEATENGNGRPSRQNSNGSKKRKFSDPTVNLEASAAKNGGEVEANENAVLPKEVSHRSPSAGEATATTFTERAAGFESSASNPNFICASASNPTAPVPGASAHAHTAPSQAPSPHMLDGDSHGEGFRKGAKDIGIGMPPRGLANDDKEGKHFEPAASMRISNLEVVIGNGEEGSELRSNKVGRHSRNLTPELDAPIFGTSGSTFAPNNSGCDSLVVASEPPMGLSVPVQSASASSPGKKSDIPHILNVSTPGSSSCAPDPCISAPAQSSATPNPKESGLGPSASTSAPIALAASNEFISPEIVWADAQPALVPGASVSASLAMLSAPAPSAPVPAASASTPTPCAYDDSASALEYAPSAPSSAFGASARAGGASVPSQRASAATPSAPVYTASAPADVPSAVAPVAMGDSGPRTGSPAPRDFDSSEADLMRVRASQDARKDVE